MSQFPWQAEYRVSTIEARHLAGLAFGLPCKQIEVLGEGWDYLNFLVDETWVLRFPKRSACDTVLIRERQILDLLNGQPLPLAVPNFEHFSDPQENFPWHFAAYPYIAGTPLSSEGIAAPDNLSDVTGEFLSALHAIGTQTELEDPWPGDDDDEWARREFESSLTAYPSSMRRRVEAFLDRPPPHEPVLPKVLTHADLNAEHILIHPENGTVTGIIDWADAYSSIRTIDFLGLYYLKGRDAVARAYQAYRAKPTEQEWGWLEHAAIGMCIGQIFYGSNDNRPALIQQGLSRLENYLSD